MFANERNLRSRFSNLNSDEGEWRQFNIEASNLLAGKPHTPEVFVSALLSASQHLKNDPTKFAQLYNSIETYAKYLIQALNNYGSNIGFQHFDLANAFKEEVLRIRNGKTPMYFTGDSESITNQMPTAKPNQPRMDEGTANQVLGQIQNKNKKVLEINRGNSSQTLLDDEEESEESEIVSSIKNVTIGELPENYYTYERLEGMSRDALRDLARSHNLSLSGATRKDDIIDNLAIELRLVGMWVETDGERKALSAADAEAEAMLPDHGMN